MKPVRRGGSGAAAERDALTRRALLEGLLLAAAGVVSSTAVAGCEAADETRAPSGTNDAAPVRRSASLLSAEESDRFRRAFEHAVRTGRLDVFSLEHSQGHAHHMHGAEVLAESPMRIALMTSTSGHRLLPWHRAFVIEAEQMLRAALRERNAIDGRDPSEADALTMPYWDASHDGRVPEWLEAFRPQGGKAVGVPDLPAGHAGSGRIGETYDIAFGRWPGENPAFPTLPPPSQLARILAHDKFVDFYRTLDLLPDVDAFSAAQLDELRRRAPGDRAVGRVLDLLATTVFDDARAVELLNAFSMLGHEAAKERLAGVPPVLLPILRELIARVRFPPHAVLHLYAGGLDPADPDVRGTVTYFHELAVDPLFWMLHCELDRLWYSWQETHADPPPLEGVHRVFRPLTAEEGAWYGGGAEYVLDALLDRTTLPYRYDVLFRE